METRAHSLMTLYKVFEGTEEGAVHPDWGLAETSKDQWDLKKGLKGGSGGGSGVAKAWTLGESRKGESVWMW